MSAQICSCASWVASIDRCGVCSHCGCVHDDGRCSSSNSRGVHSYRCYRLRRWISNEYRQVILKVNYLAESINYVCCSFSTLVYRPFEKHFLHDSFTLHENVIDNAIMIYCCLRSTGLEWVFSLCLPPCVFSPLCSALDDNSFKASWERWG